MKVVVDTSVWSLALRRNAAPAVPAEVLSLESLIRENRVVMLGCIRQELLSGIRYPEQFDRLCEHLRAFPDLRLNSEDYETAAQMFNRCRARSVQGSNTDFLVCAAAARYNLAIFTTDQDFLHYRDVVGIRLYQAAGEA